MIQFDEDISGSTAWKSCNCAWKSPLLPCSVRRSNGLHCVIPWINKPTKVLNVWLFQKVPEGEDKTWDALILPWWLVFDDADGKPSTMLPNPQFLKWYSNFWTNRMTLFFQWFSTTFFFLPRKDVQFLWFQTLWPHQFLRAYETTFGTKDFSCPRCAEARMSLLLVHVVLAAMVQNQGVLLLMVQKSSTRLRLVVYPSIYYRVLYIPGGWHLVYIHSISRLHKFGGITPSKNALFARFFGQQIVFIVRKNSTSTHPKANIAPENRPSQKELVFQPPTFQCLC